LEEGCDGLGEGFGRIGFDGEFEVW